MKAVSPFAAFLLAAALLVGGCGTAPMLGGPIPNERLSDGVVSGTYSHWPNKADVEVTIRDGKVVEIRIVHDRAWRGIKAEPVIVLRIIESQSTAVDAVAGATNSSRVIMNAVQQAIEKAASMDSEP